MVAESDRTRAIVCFAFATFLFSRQRISVSAFCPSMSASDSDLDLLLGPSHAPTEVDPCSDDASMDSVESVCLVEFLASRDAELRPPSESIIEFWCDNIPRFTSVFQSTERDSCITWRLHPDVPAIDCMPTQIRHAREVIDGVLEAGYVRCFKVGLTHKPVERYRNELYGYETLKYSELIILICSDNAGFIARAETLLLSTYRRYNTNDQCINTSGHALCKNRKPGGEGAYHGEPPYFVYLAIRRPNNTPSPSTASEVRSIIECSRKAAPCRWLLLPIA